MGKTYKERQDGAGGRPRQKHRARDDKRNPERYPNELLGDPYYTKDVNASRRRK